ncbi:Adenine-specific DNA methylase-like protein [Methylocella silvestris BL2]|uniref:site-specific DNA-methyltransferase (adenine-specific) n=2 Tax=Methylocella silvestris TaxID=199596 RepID=B8ESX6_METSB|nr:Adenine-specific DNA methylase-like protein [Methylocella silvestris BL2]
MGTKRQLAEVVSRLISDCRHGAFLDAFSGMCSVGTAVAPSRQVWSNDLQHFAAYVASAQFCSKVTHPDSSSLAETCHSFFSENRRRLRFLHEEKLQREDVALKARGTRRLAALFEEAILAANGPCASHGSPSHDLFARRFAGTYWSLRQAIDIDSIRFALDYSLCHELISAELHRWGVIGLCVALSRCSTTTGHFAQPLLPKQQNRARFVNQRLRDIWTEWLTACGGLGAVGSTRWRSKNRVYRRDAIALLEELTGECARPRVIYADPPYTKDQYSRYYHLYETAVLYDHPATSGRGLYRADREVSIFCQKTKVEFAMEELIRRCADLRADFVLSYPTNGLFPASRQRIPEIMTRYFRQSIKVIEIPHVHSTMGASKGPVRSDVTEVIYSVRP